MSSENMNLVSVDIKDSENSSSIFKSDLNHFGQDNYYHNQYDDYDEEE